MPELEGQQITGGVEDAAEGDAGDFDFLYDMAGELGDAAPDPDADTEAQAESGDSAESGEPGTGTESPDSAEADPEEKPDEQETGDEAAAADETVDAAKSGPESGEDEVIEVLAPEVEAKHHKEFSDQTKDTADSVAAKYYPMAEAAMSVVNAANTELAQLQEKYKPDSDGYAPPMSVEDHIRITELVNQRSEGVKQVRAIVQTVEQEIPTAQNAVYIQQNIKAYPALKAVEAGFTEAVNRGIPFKSVEEAYRVSLALMGGKPAAAKAQAKPSPAAAAEHKNKILEANIADKRRAAVTAGKGGAGKAGAATPGTGKGMAGRIQADQAAIEKWVF